MEEAINRLLIIILIHNNVEKWENTRDQKEKMKALRVQGTVEEF